MHNLANIWQFCNMGEKCYYNLENRPKYDYVLALIVLEKQQ